MHSCSPFPYGWHFLVTKSPTRTEHYTLETLEEHFKLGVRGASIEAGLLVRHLARLANADVEAVFNGTVIARAKAPI
jgi:hypothetical protein